jgi:hypothetical protein
MKIQVAYQLHLQNLQGASHVRVKEQVKNLITLRLAVVGEETCTIATVESANALEW